MNITTLFLKNLKTHEGSVVHMYLDTSGNVTVGCGHLLSTSGDAIGLPFFTRQKPDFAGHPITDANRLAAFSELRGSSLLRPTPAEFRLPDTRSATAAEITKDWDEVKKQSFGNFKAAYYAHFTKTWLSDAYIDTLLEADVRQKINEIRSHVFPDFESYPQSGQEAIIDMAFNLGVNKLENGFPAFVKAVKSLDWATAALESHRLPPVSNERNQAAKRLLIAARDEHAAALNLMTNLRDR